MRRGGTGRPSNPGDDAMPMPMPMPMPMSAPQPAFRGRMMTRERAPQRRPGSRSSWDFAPAHRLARLARPSRVRRTAPKTPPPTRLDIQEFTHLLLLRAALRRMNAFTIIGTVLAVGLALAGLMMQNAKTGAWTVSRTRWPCTVRRCSGWPNDRRTSKASSPHGDRARADSARRGRGRKPPHARGLVPTAPCSRAGSGRADRAGRGPEPPSGKAPHSRNQGAGRKGGREGGDGAPDTVVARHRGLREISGRRPGFRRSFGRRGGRRGPCL